MPELSNGVAPSSDVPSPRPSRPATTTTPIGPLTAWHRYPHAQAAFSERADRAWWVVTRVRWHAAGEIALDAYGCRGLVCVWHRPSIRTDSIPGSST